MKEQIKMKKLMIAAAIVCAAVCANAYQVQWGATLMGVPKAADPTKDQTGITTPMSGEGYVPFGVGELTLSLYWVSTTGNIKIDDFTISAAGATGTKSLGNETSDLYAAMLEDHGSSWQPQYVVTATYETADGVYTFNGTASSTKKLSQIGTGNVGATTIGSMGTWDYKANAVPEPTSGLLLLLGVAGLALKRKRA